MKHIAVVGSGISGLLTSYFLVKKGCKVTVFDRNAFPGGKLQTVQTPYGPAETAANGILADALVEEVCADVGVALIGTKKTSKARYIYSNKKPRRWPLGFKDSLGLLAFFLKKPWKDQNALKGKTLEAWLKLYVSSRVVERLFSPACQGIFGAGAEDLSARLVMNYFFNSGKRAKGKLRGTVSAQGGMGEIIAALKKSLLSRGVQFVHQDVTDLKALVAEYQDVVVATELSSAAQMLQAIKDYRGQVLSTVPTVDLMSINVFWKNQAAGYPGFGILFPRGEGVKALGVLQNTFIFPERSKDALSETWIYRMQDVDEDPLATVSRDRYEVLGGGEELKASRINAWPKALPLYGLKLEEVLDNFPPGHPRIHLMGNYLGEIGLNRLFARAKQLAQDI